ncbi:C2H2 and C2HC zinc fingers superfamily protein [Striga asiatica]|uniref:C2H2 and C2HC zinc fingers superfamily protein n=1 Tax=Striga asiatica TaxID=4170 RepID=A0A5A7QWV0_STRAF|nr:C2H2 and C2HC zinc fingers superfamily protein [Striga asiatica]
MVRTASTGWAPAAVSPLSITQSVPSRTAFATSVASARVGRGALTIDSSICVAVTTGFPCLNIFSIGISIPRSPLATMNASELAMMSSRALADEGEGNNVNLVRNTPLQNIVSVLIGQGGKVHNNSREIDVLSLAQESRILTTATDKPLIYIALEDHLGVQHDGAKDAGFAYGFTEIVESFLMIGVSAVREVESSYAHASLKKLL